MDGIKPVTAIHEAPITRWLFTDCPAHATIWSQLELPFPARIGFNLSPPKVEGVCVPGDIDVVVCNPANFECALAFESKRVNVKPEMFETLQPGKLQELRKGARQANALYEMGFHEAYLMICVAIDGRERHEYNFFGRGLSGPLVKNIYDFTKALDLRPEVGLVVIEINQPVDKPIEDAGAVGIKVVRRAGKQTQMAMITEWVRSCMHADISTAQ